VVEKRKAARSRTLLGDSLSKVTTRRTNVVQGVGDREVRKGSNGKVVELAVRAVVHGMPVANTDALANPEALELFKDLPELQS